MNRSGCTNLYKERSDCFKLSALPWSVAGAFVESRRHAEANFEVAFTASGQEGECAVPSQCEKCNQNPVVLITTVEQCGIRLTAIEAMNNIKPFDPTAAVLQYTAIWSELKRSVYC